MDSNQMTDAELQKAIDDQTKTAETPPPAEPEEIEIKLETGQVYKGKDWEEVARKAAKSQEEATRTIRDRESQIRIMASEKLASQQPPKPREDGKFDKTAYFKMLEEDPMAAANYVDSFRPEYQRVMAITDTVERANAAGMFMRRNPDYVDTNENRDLMAERIQVDNGNWSNPDHIERAYYGLVRDGKIKREAEEAPAKPTRPAPPPRMGGQSGDTKSIPDDSELYGMTDQQFADFMAKQGIPVPRRAR